MRLLPDRPEELTCGRFEISTNGSGEIFIRLQRYPNVQLRISDSGIESITVTAYGCNMNPTSVNGLDAFRITGRK
jgi:hypothetical protein